MHRTTIGILALCLAATATATATPLTQKVGKEAAKGVAKGVEEQHVDFGQSSRELTSGMVDALYSRRQKVDAMAFEVGRELVRGAFTSASENGCDGDRHCLRTQTHEIAYTLGRGLAQGISAKLSIVPSLIGFALGFVFAAVLAGLAFLLLRNKRRDAVPHVG